MLHMIQTALKEFGNMVVVQRVKDLTPILARTHQVHQAQPTQV